MGETMREKWPPQIAHYIRVERAIPDWAVDLFGLSWDEARQAIAIPIEGLMKYRSMRGYDPERGARPPIDNKMFWADRTERQASEPWPPFPSWVDWREAHVIVEGEFDSIVAFTNGITAVSGTMGCRVFTEPWADALSGQSRVLLYDHDESGRAGALVAAQALNRSGCFVRIASWPADRPSGWDITDHFRNGGTVDEIRDIIAAALPYEPPHTPVFRGRVLGGVTL